MLPEDEFNDVDAVFLPDETLQRNEEDGNDDYNET